MNVIDTIVCGGKEYAITELHHSVVEWFQNVFGNFDYQIFEFFNSLHEGALGFILDPFFKIYTTLGDEGIIFILIGLALLLFRKTRKSGLGMLFGMLFGLLFTNIVLKELIERPRPFVLEQLLPGNEAAMLFNDWWVEMGEIHASVLRSFPSGHTTSAFAAMVPLFMIEKKKFSWTALVAALLMGASRIYVMVHYPSDVLGGIIVGSLAGICGLILVNIIYKKLKEKNNKACNKIVDFDIIRLVKKES